MRMLVETIHVDAGKRLFDVKDKSRYVRDPVILGRQVFCEACGRAYLLGERILDYLGIPCCPSKAGNVECDGSGETLIFVRDRTHLLDLERSCKTRYPF